MITDALHSQEKKKKKPVLKVCDFPNAEPEPGPSCSQELPRGNPVVSEIEV
jgi:hypothetical protein